MPRRDDTPAKPKPPLVHEQLRQQREMRRQKVLDRLDEILELYALGHSFEQIIGLLQLNESPNYVRQILQTTCYKEFVAAYKNRAHSLVEKAVDVARQSIAIGDAAGYRVAVDTFLKVAAKLSPEDYGDKSRVEHTGRDGGPIKLQASTLSDDELAAIVARGNQAQEDDE